MTYTIGGDATATTVTTVTSAYTASDGELVLADASGGAFPIALPPAENGTTVSVKKIDASGNGVTIATPTTETIDGSASITLSADSETVEIVGDGTNYTITYRTGYGN